MGELFNPNSQILNGSNAVPSENYSSHISMSSLPSDFNLGESQSSTALYEHRCRKCHLPPQDEITGWLHLIKDVY